MTTQIDDDDDATRAELTHRADDTRHRLAETIEALEVRRQEFFDDTKTIRTRALQIAVLFGVGSLALGGAVVYATERWQTRAERKARARVYAVTRFWKHPEEMQPRKSFFTSLVERTALAVVPFLIARAVKQYAPPREPRALPPHR